MKTADAAPEAAVPWTEQPRSPRAEPREREQSIRQHVLLLALLCSLALAAKLAAQVGALLALPPLAGTASCMHLWL